MKEVDYEGKKVIIEKGRTYWISDTGERIQMTQEELIAFRRWKENNIYAQKTHEAIMKSEHGEKIEKAISIEKFNQNVKRRREANKRERMRFYGRKETVNDVPEWNPDFAVRDEMKAIEIWGHLHSYEFVTGETAFITIEDIDGNKHKCFVESKSKMFDMIKRLYPPSVKNYAKVTDFKNILDDGITEKKLLLWRLIKPEYVKEFFSMIRRTPQYPYLFATLTKRFKPYKIDDFKTTDTYKAIIEKFEAVEEAGYDGVRAGKLILTGSEILAIGQPSVILDFGLLGQSSIKIYATFKILSCSNQLTLIGSSLYQNNYTISFNIKRRHTDYVESIIDDIDEIIAGLDSFEYLLDESKIVNVSDLDMQYICKHFIKNKKMSNKIANKVYDLWSAEDITQVPNTIYGLAMVFSYIATHERIKDGVRWNMSGAAGELILMATSWDEYMREVKKEVLKISGDSLLQISESD